jgi:adenosylhomocysteine nucleosidase
MMRRPSALFAAILTGIALIWAPVASAQARDPVARIAVMSAFAPELTALEAQVEGRQAQTVNGVTFITGRLMGKDVVLFLSGVSMVNAAMTTQMALDRFTIDRIVFSGIAGGVDPSLDVGDVVVSEQWGQYLEVVMARRTPGGYELPPGRPVSESGHAAFGMMFPSEVSIARGSERPERKFWFAADPAMIEVARKVAAGVTLKRCIEDRCLIKAPKIVVGGNGVSGAAFVDNAELRDWAFRTFHAQVLDMETAAVGHVAYVNNKTPFIAFRSLSDLAGGDPGHNQARTFFQLASDNSAAFVLAFLKALP